MLRYTLTITLFLPLLTFSQDYSTFEFYHYDAAFNHTIFNGDYKMEEKVRDENVQKMTKAFHYKGKTNRTEYTFNDHHRISAIEYSNGGYYQYNYLNDTVLSEVEINGKKGVRHFNLEYNNGRLINTKETFNNELVSLKSQHFDQSGRVIHTTLNYPKKRKSVSIFRVFEGDQLKQIQHYKNGKVVRFLDYSCKPQGEEMKSAVTAQVCEYQEEANDGSFIKYTRDERKTGVYLVKKFYTSDATLYQVESFMNDTVLISRQEIDGYNNTLAYFKKDGSIRSKTVKSEEENVFKSTTFNSKGKVVKFEEIEYNANRQILSKKNSSNGKSRKTYSSEYTYNSDGLLVNEKRFKGDKLLWESEYEYVK